MRGATFDVGIIGRIAIQLLAVFSLSVSGFPSGSGLTGEYFDNPDFTGLKAVRIDRAVDFDWGTGAPTNTIAADSFSIRWSGQVEPEFSETYVFFVTADDGARLWVNDRLVLARTTYSAAAMEMCGRVNLSAGRRYNIMMEFLETTGKAQVQLAWSSESQSKQIIPQNRLYPSLSVPEAGSILLEHWMNLPGTNVDSIAATANFPTRPDSREFLTSLETLQPDWADDYATRVTGFLEPPADGNYRFAVSGSASVQLFLGTNSNPVGLQLIASNTVPTPFRDFTLLTGQVSAPITLNSHQHYRVELLHKAGRGPDHFSVGWMEPGATNFAIIPAMALVPAGLDRTDPSQNHYLDTLSSSHPRLLASPQRFEKLRRTLAANGVPQLTTWWGTVSNSAYSILSQPVNEYNQDVRGTILAISRSVLDRMYKPCHYPHLFMPSLD